MNDPLAQKQRFTLLCQRHQELYGDGAVRLLRAPARINVLGEHVDYVSYLPTASLIFGSGEHDMLMAFRASDTDIVRGASTSDAFQPFAFSLAAAETIQGQEETWTDWLYSQAIPVPHWGNYVRGAAFFARHQYGNQISRGFDFVVDSTIPAKGGASSSSALTVLAGAALRLVNEAGCERHSLAQQSAQAEWFVGTRGGAMDHTAICLSQAGCAVHLSYADNEIESIPLLSDDYRWITFFTHEADKGREIMLEYNERAAVARLLIPAFLTNAPATDQKVSDAIHNLPTSTTLAEFARNHPQAFADCQRAFPALVQERGDHPVKIRDRALHHLGEVQRVAEAIAVLRQTDESELTAQRLGALLNAAHASLRDRYEISTPQVEELINIIAAEPHVYGARLMGGGFGGNVLALTKAEYVTDLVERVQRDFYTPQQRHGVNEGAVMISTPGDGLAEIELNNQQ